MKKQINVVDLSSVEQLELNAILDGAENKLQEISPELRALFVDGFGRQLGIEEKTAGDFVTNSDKQIEQVFKDWVGKNFSGHTVYGEETGGVEEDETPEWLWAIDPIDGTNNYQFGNPDSSIVISLRYRGEPVLALCDLPAKNEGRGLYYFARLGKGAYCNGTQISATKIQELKYVPLVATRLTHSERMMTMVGNIWDRVAGVHMNMSSVYEACRVASGEMGIGVFYANGPHEWPAMYLFAQEAGCIIGPLGKPDTAVNLTGIGNRNFLIAGNINLYNEAKGIVHVPPNL